MNTATPIANLQLFRLNKINKKFNYLFSKQEIQNIIADFNKFNRFKEFVKFTDEEIEIVNSYPATRYRLRQFVLSPFSEFSDLENLSIYKNGLLFMTAIFRDGEPVVPDFYVDRYSDSTLTGSLVVEVSINGVLVWFAVAGRIVIEVCGVSLCDYFEFFC